MLLSAKSSPQKGEGNLAKEIQAFCQDIPVSSSKLMKVSLLLDYNICFYCRYVKHNHGCRFRQDVTSP